MPRSSAVFGRPQQPAPPPETAAVPLGPAAEPPLEPAPSRASGPEFSAGVPSRPAGVLREWLDALVIAFVLAMFLRTFMIELYKIPTGSMTPTLVGGLVAEVDYNGDGRRDLLLLRPRPEPGQQAQPLVFLRVGDHLEPAGEASLGAGEIDRLVRQAHVRNDRILVNKFAYWFHQPRRGDIVVFKVPERIWEADKPIYIKRLVGEPGDRLTFDNDGHLLANGTPPALPFFRQQSYELWLPPGTGRPEVTYEEDLFQNRRIERIHVPRGEIYVFGDNTLSSLDSRYWGGVPLSLVRGRAFCRFWPAAEFAVLHDK